MKTHTRSMSFNQEKMSLYKQQATFATATASVISLVKFQRATELRDKSALSRHAVYTNIYNSTELSWVIHHHTSNLTSLKLLNQVEAIQKLRGVGNVALHRFQLLQFAAALGCCPGCQWAMLWSLTRLPNFLASRSTPCWQCWQCWQKLPPGELT